MVFLIFSELSGKPTDQYGDFHRALSALGPWAELGKGGWLAESDRLNASQIRDLLRPHLAEQDKLFVARISKNWAGLRMAGAFPEWMKRRNFDAPTAKLAPILASCGFRPGGRRAWAMLPRRAPL